MHAFRLAAVAALMMAGPGLAAAQTVGAGQITPSTTLGQYLGFAIGQMADGITADSPFNGYASGLGVTSGRITLALDQAYDLSSFVLWNDINVLNEGVRTFTMSFQDAAGADLGSTGVLSAVSMLAPQTYTFAASVNGVKTVQLDVLTSSLQIEIREVAFNGMVSSVPEPSPAALLACGLAALALRRRLRAGLRAAT